MSYKRGLAVVFACLIASAVAFAATYPRFFAAPQTQQASVAGALPAPSSVPALTIALPPIIDDNPLSWSHLTPQQQAALAPFATEWNKFGDWRKRKWLKIAARFAKMSPAAQRRLHERMAQWVRMTPEQRRVARENYQVSKTLPPQVRSKAWKAYQRLSPEQKAKLAALARKRRPTVVSAPPSGRKSEIRGISRLADASIGAASSAPSASSAGAASSAAPASAPAPSAPEPTPLSPSEAPSVFRGA